MAKETYPVDFVMTVGGEKVLIKSQSPLDKEKEAAKLKAYAKEIADATGKDA